MQTHILLYFQFMCNFFHSKKRTIFRWLVVLLLASFVQSVDARIKKPKLKKTETAETKHESYVMMDLKGQLGNQMFRIATAYGYAWDHEVAPYFPDLVKNPDEGIPTNYKHVFFRCDTKTPQGAKPKIWRQPRQFHFSYIPIPYCSHLRLDGIFQNEKYFARYRNRILELFKPRHEDLAYIEERYKNVLSHPNTVGVQIRNFGILKDEEAWVWAAQYGYDYFSKAMALFPKDSLFVVSANDLDFAKKNIPQDYNNIIFLENEDYYIELFLLSKLHHNVISNSTFGWWAAWLNQNPNKMVIAPRNWIDPNFLQGSLEVYPEEWIQIDAQWEKIVHTN